MPSCASMRIEKQPRTLEKISTLRRILALIGHYLALIGPYRAKCTSDRVLSINFLQSVTCNVCTDFFPSFTLSSLDEPKICRYYNFLPLGETIFAERCLKKEDFPDISQSNGQSVYKLFMAFMLNNAHDLDDVTTWIARQFIALNYSSVQRLTG